MKISFSAYLDGQQNFSQIIQIYARWSQTMFFAQNFHAHKVYQLITFHFNDHFQHSQIAQFLNIFSTSYFNLIISSNYSVFCSPSPAYSTCFTKIKFSAQTSDTVEDQRLTAGEHFSAREFWVEILNGTNTNATAYMLCRSLLMQFVAETLSRFQLSSAKGCLWTLFFLMKSTFFRNIWKFLPRRFLLPLRQEWVELR